jgi:DNA-binding transcriptional ArsR family regulator
MYDRHPTSDARSKQLIDRIRQEIQERLEQVLAEAEKLRAALAALDPRERPKAERSRARSTGARKTGRATAKSTASASAAPSAPAPAPAPKKASSRSASASANSRTAPGATKNSVLAALEKGGAMTAGEVASATGLGRGTVSTTLSKLAKSGVVVKADRGYRLPDGNSASAAKAAVASGSDGAS